MTRRGDKTTSRQTGTRRTKTTGARSVARSPDSARNAALGPEARRDIFGIALIAISIALAIALLNESAGLVGGAAATAMRQVFGAGSFVVPVLLLVWGLTFFVRAFAISERRVGAGLCLVFLALIGMFAMASPTESLFDSELVHLHGGYVGSAIAWTLRSLLGSEIAYVTLGATMLIGLVVAGMSVSGIVEWATKRFGGTRSGDGPAPRQNLPRERAPRTVPLGDTDALSRPAATRRKEPGTPDLEARKATQPTPRARPPKALEGFEVPPSSLLTRTPESASRSRASDRELSSTARLIEDTLATFDIQARVVSWIPGPTVTMYEIELSRGIKVSRITQLADDLALALAAQTVRILAPIPGKSLVGIEVPNAERSTVTLGDILSAPSAQGGGPLTLAIGKDVAGDSVLADLATMPHLLIAGSTGTGKSVCINALLMSILMRTTPAEVRLILIDPKRIELSLYNGVPHLYVPVVTEPKEAASALHWAVGEMDARLKRLQKAGARNIGAYNAMVQDGTAPEGEREMPYLMIVIDELADLMMVAAKEIEDSICRLAQLARAAGIHLVVATQRPSTDIITGLIKTNITNRIAFAVSSGIDSRVILDQPGAEKLIGEGDMLFSTPKLDKPKRIQGAFLTESEIIAVVEHLKGQAEPEYHEEILHLKVTPGGGGMGHADDDDPLVWEAADIVVTSGIGSTSLLQRRLKVGYARAGRIMDMLESKGVVGQPDGSKPREVLVDVEDLEAIKAFERSDRSDDPKEV
ncbi:MAG: DNA translocase FtsK 4TM domain-containing protein [Clostridiales bacterium]|nr:DNA translocase FtsK 4TM domain-containing protein [Clostridiales bacterium]